ncbi:DUF4352 domain-containing protein [Enemella evansiae]|uniref:DUF4352 domain-containing protein n=1 Tax=Enemella evansiae TaxID=2016499 RepID=UPI000B977B5C|nr:DUF4352 domain-containing protein [Enemella evansiae]OYO02696.1 hypothetical protein CGZ97_14985 [Enemella evansiae]
MSQQQPPQRPHQQHPNYAMYPPQGQPQPGPAGPPPKAKKPIHKRIWFWLLLVLVGIVLISQAGGGGSESADGDGQPAGQPARAGKTTPPPAGLNTPVKDEDLEFTVTGFKCGVSVEDPLTKIQPQGQFCKMDLSVKNLGSKQETLLDNNVKVLDDKGAEYASGSETFIVKDVIVLKQINPGNTLTGSIYYDVPADVTPTRAKVQGSMFSRGGTIALA